MKTPRGAARQSGNVVPRSGVDSSCATPLGGEAAQATAPGPLQFKEIALRGLIHHVVLKHNFVRGWLERNLSIPSGQFPDDEQIAAIAAVSGTVQITARAGSGKTTTLIRRACFLMRHCKVQANQILLLAFNRAAVLDVRKKLLLTLCPAAEGTVAQAMHARERVNLKPLDREVAAVDNAIDIHQVAMPSVMTFHALAYGLVNPQQTLLIDGADGNGFGLSRVLQDVIDDHLRDNNWQPRIRQMMLAHFRHDWEVVENGGYAIPDRDALLAHRRALQRETLRGEYVKSFGEKVIADFLLEHGVPYKYERNHRWSGFNYRPDFTLFRRAGRNASGVIIEYFGLQGEPDYDEQSARKREYWSNKPQWDFLEFSPAVIFREGVEAFRSRLRSALIPLGFACEPLAADVLWEKVKKRAIGRFTKAMVTFIGRCRKRLVTPEKLDALIASHQPATDAEAQFLPLARRFYAGYLQALRATDSEDFDGIMQRAINAVQTGETLVRRGGHVVCDLARVRFLSVDEFQDFSELFYRLVHAIRKRGDGVQCFCVGDDWQAINGFAGSDLKYFREFTKYMGDSTRLAITTNYRSSQAVVAAGNAVMDGNGTSARARPEAPAGTILFANMDDFDATLLEQKNHRGDDITPAVLRIAATSIAAGRSVAVLCRRNTIPWYVNLEGDRSLHAYVERLRGFFPEDSRHKISVATTHKFKGLERDDVIVIDAVRRSYPLVHPDWVFSRVLGESIEQIVAEERRLFYVAVTRAKGTVILFADMKNESEFLADLKAKTTVTVVNWNDYAPHDVDSRRYVIQITSRPGMGVRNDNGGLDQPTFVIRESLRLSEYRFRGGAKKVWEKTVSVDNFEISKILSELWVPDASGIDVVECDGANKVVGKWLVDGGEFQEVAF
ncbi:MAG: UvrD-helicase domain-containing protein [Proteobacteria bacterium]|nr:UvrD-helicase domain-containing protein [Pseudomonadota bacterium]